MSDKLVGYVLLALAMATVGTTVIASKYIAAAMPPFPATALRFGLALPVLAALMLATGQRVPRLPAKTWLFLALQAGAGSVGYTVLLISGLRHVPATDAGVIVGTLPAVSAIFAVLVLGEKPGARTWLAVVFATAGVLIVVWKASGPASLLGTVLILGAVVCESGFILMQKRMRTPLPPLAQATLMTGLGLVLTLPPALPDLSVPAFTTPAFLAIVWYALVPTVGGFLLWYAGAARVKGAEAAVFTAVAPVTAVLLSAVVLGEPVGWSSAIGLLAVAGAILILSWRRTADQ
jgi:drug/metabolite transporter (DMT)-like permease